MVLKMSRGISCQYYVRLVLLFLLDIWRIVYYYNFAEIIFEQWHSGLLELACTITNDF